MMTEKILFCNFRVCFGAVSKRAEKKIPSEVLKKYLDFSLIAQKNELLVEYVIFLKPPFKAFSYDEIKSH